MEQQEATGVVQGTPMVLVVQMPQADAMKILIPVPEEAGAEEAVDPGEEYCSIPNVVRWSYQVPWRQKAEMADLEEAGELDQARLVREQQGQAVVAVAVAG